MKPREPNPGNRTLIRHLMCQRLPRGVAPLSSSLQGQSFTGVGTGTTANPWGNFRIERLHSCQLSYHQHPGTSGGGMNPRIDVRGARLRLLLLLCPFCLVRLASAQNPQSTQSPSPTQSSSTIAALPASKTPISKALPKTLDASPTPSWPPSDVDEAVPPVESNRACVLPQVLSRAAHRIEELVRDLDRFSATEIVQHQKVDHAGHLHEPETNRFDYLVSLSCRSGGFLNVEEYRKARTGKDQFPDHVATEGTPSLVLLFHPRYASNFSFNCEGLGEWRGKPAWQVRFEQRDIRRSMIAMVMEDHTYNVKIRGRAWILADSYEV